MLESTPPLPEGKVISKKTLTFRSDPNITYACVHMRTNTKYEQLWLGEVSPSLIMVVFNKNQSKFGILSPIFTDD